MDAVTLLHRLAGWLEPARLASGAVVLAVAVTLLPAVRRRRVGPAGTAGLALLALGAIPALAPLPWQVNLGLLTAVAALAFAHLRAAPGADHDDGSRRSRRAVVVVAAALLLVGFFTVPRLGSYAGALLVWECEVAEGFAAAYRDGVGALSLLGQHLLWGNGAVSEGHSSLLYGGATYPLLLHAGFTTTVLRAVAAALGLLTVPLFFAQARRWLPTGATLLATAAWSLSTTVLLYARYGTSLSATLATLLLATLAVGAVRERGARSWWPAPLASVALIVATLHYAVGRLVVLLLLAAAVGFLVRDARRLTRAGVAGALLAAALLAGFVALQVRSGRAGLFFKAHGEQIFGILASPHEAARYLGRPLPAGRPARSEAAALGAALVRANLPDLGRLAGVVAWPEPSAQPGWRALRADPPQLPLYFLPLLPFVVLGASSSLRRWRAWPDALLLAWFAITVAAALLSNRVDHHRLMTLCIPLCVWLGVGLNLALALLRRAGLSRVARGALFGALAVAALLEAAWQLERPRPLAGSPLVAATEQALRALDGPVTAAFAADFRERTEAQLLVLERERALGLPPHEPLQLRLQQALDDPRQRPRFADTLVLAIGNIVGNGTLLLGPAADTKALAAGLEAQGFRVRPLDGPVGLFAVTAPANGVSGP